MDDTSPRLCSDVPERLGGHYPERPLAAIREEGIVMIWEDVLANRFSTIRKQDEAEKVK